MFVIDRPKIMRIHKLLFLGFVIVALSNENWDSNLKKISKDEAVTLKINARLKLIKDIIKQRANDSIILVTGPNESDIAQKICQNPKNPRL